VKGYDLMKKPTSGSFFGSKKSGLLRTQKRKIETISFRNFAPLQLVQVDRHFVVRTRLTAAASDVPAKRNVGRIVPATRLLTPRAK
jgi:hypothetical protein